MIPSQDFLLTYTWYTKINIIPRASQFVGSEYCGETI